MSQFTEADAVAMGQMVAAIGESCPAKAAISYVGGGAMGALFGLFMSSIDFNSTTAIADKPMREQMRIMGKEMAARSVSSAKSLSVIGGIYAGTECVVESYRAKSDLWNGAISGCITGAALGVKGGPKNAVFGCVPFAAFSVAIDYYFKRME
ncbi:mitochondrial inner membrane translocase subunit Tim17/Tim22/Tim23/peroxisomal protein PMP24 [Blastocladiella britannica]|nr:mitochondrial inner membrane translocase subunit Tim17/Tim22/Tim23/peroxisomal protein PMP24 [Blastocladiella britannica]